MIKLEVAKGGKLRGLERSFLIRNQNRN